MNLYRSLAFKNAIIYLLLFLTGLAIVGYVVLSYSSERIIETAENRLRHNGDLFTIQLEDYLDNLSSSIDHLSTSPLLAKFIEQANDGNYNFLLEDYLSIIRAQDDFSQIRYIAVDTGKELARVDRKNDQSQIVAKEDLQVKKDRSYFLEGLDLKEDEIYFSPIDLNKEQGKISEPLTPTLRVTKAIYKGNSIHGILVINTDLRKLFDRLKKSMGQDFLLRIMNEEGYYLLHEQVDSTFLFEFPQLNVQPTQLTIPEEHVEVYSTVEEIIARRRLSLSILKYDLSYILIADKSKLLTTYYTWRSRSIFLILFIGLVFTLLAFLLLNKQAKTLDQLTSVMKAFPGNKSVEDLPIGRNDEIGELAKGFKEMSSIIKTQIETIESEKIKAIQAEKQKSDFIEDISHEIRNPLQSIMGLSKLLEQNKPNPNQIDILNSIKLNTSNLHNLVNNVLDYQNVIKGNVKLQEDWHDVNKLLHEIAISNQFRASEKSIEIITKLDKGLENKDIYIDALAISKILNNLITNAITHTRKNGRIVIENKVVSQTDEQVLVEFAVLDDGSGISKEYLEKINTRYVTSDTSSAGSTNFGLGLSIVNELLHRLSSKLEVTSKLDVGSRFSFELNRPFLLQKKEEKVSVSLDFLKDAKLLVLEDDQQLVDLYKHYFEGLNVEYSGRIEEAPDYALKFDFIIADFQLDGKTLTDYLPTLMNWSKDNTCLLVVSGKELNKSDFEDNFRIVETLQKPVLQKNLVTVLSMLQVCSVYGVPQLDVIKRDYDYQEKKYATALQLLLVEWKKYIGELSTSILNKDKEGMEDILHKLNTTLRRIKLPLLEEWLITIKDGLSTVEPVNHQLVAELERVMNSYLDFIKKDI